MLDTVLIELIQDPSVTQFFTIGHGEDSIVLQFNGNRVCRVVKVNGVHVLNMGFTVVGLIHPEKHSASTVFGSLGNTLPQ